MKEIKELGSYELDTKTDYGFTEDKELPLITERNIIALVDKVNELTREVNRLNQQNK